MRKAQVVADHEANTRRRSCCSCVRLGNRLWPWALILELRLLYAVGGFWLAVAGFFLLPFTVPLAAFLAGVIYGNWGPLLLVGGVAVSAAVGTLGVTILKK